MLKLNSKKNHYTFNHGKKVNNMERILKFLKDAEVYYLATVDGDQPRVRPFGTATLFEDKIYILTAKSKDVSKQIAANSKFEISAMDKQGRWIRLSGVLKADNRLEVHKALLADYPHLCSMYTAGDDNTNALYLDEIKATIFSFNGEPEVIAP